MSLYTLFTIIGVVAGGGAAWLLRLPRRERRMSLGFFLSAVVGIVVGAKAPLLISYGARPDFQWLDFLLTGKSFLGGVVGAFIAINVYKAATRQMASSFGGRFVIPVAVAAGFGKIGCYFNGCCGGDFAVPPQLVESAFQFCAAVALYAAYRKTQRLDLLFPFYLVSYLVMRFMVEFVRTEPRLAFGLTLYQWIALAVIPAGLGIIIIRAKQVAVQSQKGGE